MTIHLRGKSLIFDRRDTRKIHLKLPAARKNSRLGKAGLSQSLIHFCKHHLFASSGGNSSEARIQLHFQRRDFAQSLARAGMKTAPNNRQTFLKNLLVQLGLKSCEYGSEFCFIRSDLSG